MNMRSYDSIRLTRTLVMALVLSACSATPPKPEDARSAMTVDDVVADMNSETRASDEQRQMEPTPQAVETPREPVVKLGSGEFLNPRPASGWQKTGRGEIQLNFADADLREVVRVILGDILQKNYVIDPNVKGRASLQTSRALATSELLPVLESLLQLHGAALVQEDGAYQVVSLANAVRLAPSPGSTERGASGFGTQLVPLKYVSAHSMRKNLEPFVPPGSQVRIEQGRNLLMLTGPGNVVNNLIETVRMFDADWLTGMSFAVFPLQYSNPKNVSDELQLLLDSRNPDAPLTNVVRIEPVERLNALLVVSKQPEYVQQVGGLIDQLDQGLDSPGRRLYVYPVLHSTAEYIAGVLRELFVTPEEESQPRPTPVAAVPAVPVAPAAPAPVDLGDGSVVEVPPPAPAAAAPVMTPGLATGSDSSSVESQGPINIIPDEANNSVLILASPQDYRLVEAALRRLDVSPRQVLIEATIAEVTLNDRLQYGVQWFLDGKLDSYNTQALSSSGSSSSIPGFSVPGFSFALAKGVSDVRFLFDILSSASELKVLSSPKVLVVDNETASIRVGDQIPVITRQTSGTDADSNIVNEVQFRDTGVLLRVRPRIKAGGLVTMEISQETSEPSADQFAAGNVSILQRTIESTIVVPSGEAVVLGGLIRENKTLTETGIPFFSSLPIIGKLFSRTVDTVNRTELLVTITPRVVDDPQQAEAATDELRRRLRRVGEWMEETKH